MVIQSENMSQADFIRAVLERDAKNIYKAQQLIVSERIYLKGKDLKATRRRKGIQRRTGRLEDSVSHPDYIIQSQGEEFKLALNYPLYIRFLDMRKKGNWRIYRHPIWGIINNHTIPDLKYKYGEAIADKMGNLLKGAFEKYKK
jgi:hypothetical protein